jgi:hypothetical protein
MATCLQSINILPEDTRDRNGNQRFFFLHPVDFVAPRNDPPDFLVQILPISLTVTLPERAPVKFRGMTNVRGNLALKTLLRNDSYVRLGWLD